MNSSGIKRGLASSAIAALAVAGLPLLASSASAAPVALAGSGAVSLVSVADNDTISAKADGTDSTVRLTALASSDVTAVTFQYSLDGTNWTTIGTATADDGAFGYEWNPSAVAGGTVRLRAVAGSVNSTPVTGIVVNNTADTVNLTAGSSLGVFQSPYGTGQNVIVSGTSSAGGTVNFGRWNGTAFVAAGTGTAAVASGATTGTFTSAVDITGYTYGATDQLLLSANLGATTGADTESYTLYKQTITTVTASADKTLLPAGQNATVTVTVKDQNGNPIAGARVGNGGTTKITNAKGQQTFDQLAGSTVSYYADATNSAGYEPAVGDKQSDAITVTQYAAAPNSIKATSADGAAFDLSEYVLGDIKATVLDQNGNPVLQAGRTVNYYWTETPFDGSPATQRFPAVAPNVSTATTDANGQITVTFPAGQTDGDGTYVLTAGLAADNLGNGAVAPADVLTVKAGESVGPVFDSTSFQGGSGSTVTATGKITLTDGTPLPGRTIRLTYNAGGGNASLINDSGTNVAQLDVVTATDGTFSAKVKDPTSTPPVAENGTLTATPVPLFAPAGNTGIRFATSLTPAQVLVSDPNSTNTAGTVKTYSITVNADSDPGTGFTADPLANTDVTLTLDHGFFTPNTPTPAATPAAGDDAGNLKNLGTTITVKTNGSGVATVTTTIGKDAGFDDDGLVAAKITATAGSASASDTDTWTSANPLNGGTAAIDLAPAAFQASTVLPDARNDQDVALDVYVTDQFGNKVPGATVSLKGTGSAAGVDTTITPNVTVDNDYDVSASALGAGTITVSWNTKTTKYDATGAVVVSSPPAGETLTDSQAVSFYAYDITTATLTLDDDTNGSAVVGQAVTETAKVLDSKGQPVQGVDVAFLRQGPGGVTDGDPNLTQTTNAKGEAYYSFTGTSVGTAKVSAVFSDDTGRKTLTDSVAITGGSAPTAIKVTLTGDNNGGKDDKLVVTTTGKAAGADITIYKVKKNGKKGAVVATATVTGSGTTKVTVPDTNGKKSTKYVAVVSKTSDTKAGTSNKKSVK